MSTGSHSPQKTLVAFATGWGSEFGGINVFNSEFLQHLAFATQGHVTVVCVVPAASTQQIESAEEQGITLVPLPYIPAPLKLEPFHAKPVVEKLNNLGVATGEQEVVWLGHDRMTGAVALEAKALAGGRVAIIHHMSYTHYEAYAESASSAHSPSGSLDIHLFYERAPQCRCCKDQTRTSWSCCIRECSQVCSCQSRFPRCVEEPTTPRFARC